MSTTTDTNQVNFNPAWMQTTPLRIDRGSFNRGSDADDKMEMIAPVFAKHRYGREDILAMMQKSTRPPDGLRKCQYFVEEGQLPIILSILNETEMRLQQNINSSKALSLLTHQERQAINGAGSNSQPTSPWSTANSNKTTAAAKPGSRWSALTSNDSSNGGSGYVKAGMARGGGTVAGRGGGIAGTRGGRFDSSRGGYTSGGTRSRLRSSSDDDPSSAAAAGWTTVGTKVKDESSSVWRNTGKSSDAAAADERFASSETNGGFHRSGRGGLTASTASRGGRMGVDRFEPDYKRSESHDPTIINEWGRQTSPEFHQLNKGMDRINLSHSPPSKTATDEQQQQYNNVENNYSRQDSNAVNASKLINERQVNDNDPLQQFLNTITSSSSPPIIEADTWYYLDPQGGQHGPYETIQMLIWYNSKFFREDLKCTRSLNQPFTTLGELIQKNGRETPFIFQKIEQQPILPPVLENAWRSPHNPHDYYESQRAIMEEKRRLEEKQEALHRAEMERIEKERRVREMEAEILRKQEELMKVATEREEELERKRRQLAEYEQKTKQEAERRLVEQRAKEQLEARRLQEQMERERQEYEESQRKQQEEFRRQQRQAAEEAEHLRQQAMVEARKAAAAAEEAERQRQQQERLENERRQQHEERLKIEHLKQLAEAQKRREAEEAATKAAAARAAAATAAKAPWTAPNVSKDKPHVLQTQRSLLEIQLEEEKALEEKRRKEQELFELQRKQTAAKPAGPWAAGSTTITSTVVPKSVVWGSSDPSNRSPVNQRAAAAAAPIINNSAWPAMPTPPPAKKEAPPKQQQPKQNAQKKQSDAKKDNNEFQKWAIKSIKDLNKSVGATVDPEMFFGFIESVIDPVDVEDYFVTYFGESDAVKEFQKKFLEKRIALRPKQKKNDKDDLSAAQSALNPSQASDAAGKKKKKGKGPIKTVDLTVLGFKAGGDPNRINAGEIDTAPPVSMKKRR